MIYWHQNTAYYYELYTYHCTGRICSDWFPEYLINNNERKMLKAWERKLKNWQVWLLPNRDMSWDMESEHCLNSLVLSIPCHFVINCIIHITALTNKGEQKKIEHWVLSIITREPAVLITLYLMNQSRSFYKLTTQTKCNQPCTQGALKFDYCWHWLAVCRYQLGHIYIMAYT